MARVVVEVYRAVIDDDLDKAEEALQFLAGWEAATHPEIDGEPIVRTAVLDPDRVPLVHQTVEGVPDDVLDDYYDEEEHEEFELRDLVAQHGGTLHETVSTATSLAMTRARDGGYRVYEIDAVGERTEFDRWYETLEDAIRASAIGYGHPPGTLTWKEVAANK